MEIVKLNTKTGTRDYGYSVVELLVTLALFSTLILIGAANLRELDDPLQDGASQMLGFIKQVRAAAISSTSAMIVSPGTTTTVVVQQGVSCSDAAPVDYPALALTLPETVSFSDIVWSFCFSSRGLADTNVSIPLVDTDGADKTVEVLLGGAARLL